MTEYTERDLFSLIEKNRIEQEADFFKIISPSAKLKPDQKEVLRNVLKKFNRIKKTHFTSKKRKIDYDFLVNIGSGEIVLVIEQEDDNVSQSGDMSNSTTPSRRKNWEDLSKRHKDRLIAPLLQTIQELAMDVNTDTGTICQFLASKCELKSEKCLPTEAAAAMISDGKFGRATYRSQRKLFIANGINILPSWNEIRELRVKISPQLIRLEPPLVGVMCSLTEAITLTISQLLKLDSFELPTAAENFCLNIKFGFDGSGGHAIFNQVGNSSSNNMIMAMFCPLSISNQDGTNIFWQQRAPNSEFSQRPLLIEMGKESEENLRSLAMFNSDIKNLKCSGVEVDGKLFHINVAATCLDRKASNLYLGIGGAYCDLCTCSKQQGCNENFIQEGFKIDRNIESMQQVFIDLVDENGVVTKRPNDYAVRAGQTAEPIADSDVRSVQVLHALLRCFDHFMKVVVRINAGVFYWTEAKTDPSNRFLDAEKAKLQQKILQRTGIKWNFADATGHSGNTTTGNVVRKLLYSEQNRCLITEDIANLELRSFMLQYGKDLSHILRVISSGKQVNTETFSKLCSSLYLNIVQKLPWVSITPTLHKLLAHAPELIELNSGFGLKAWSEEGLEANNKRMRQIRTNLSRKDNQVNNLSDIYNRLWFGSDPLVVEERLKGRVVCKNCHEVGHGMCKQSQSTDDVDYLFS